MQVNGSEVRFSSPAEALDAGIGMVHQHFMLVEPFTVLENLVLGLEPGSPLFLDLEAARRKATALMEALGFEVPLDERVENLPVGLQQRVEILKALYREARILILDEPTAVLTPQEAEELFRFLREYVARGNAAIFISHKLKEVLAVSDRVTVIRDGKVVGTVRTRETSLEALARMMVGREVVLRVEKTPARPGEVVLEVEGLEAPPRLKGVSFQVRSGEIVGIAGVEGNGQTELVEALTGLRPFRGKALLLGRPLPASARGVRDLGASHVPEDRLVRGLVLDFSVKENAVLGDQHRPPFRGFLGFLDDRAAEAHARTLVEAYDVRPRSTARDGRNRPGSRSAEHVQVELCRACADEGHIEGLGETRRGHTQRTALVTRRGRTEAHAHFACRAGGETATVAGTRAIVADDGEGTFRITFGEGRRRKGNATNDRRIVIGEDQSVTEYIRLLDTDTAR